MLSKIHDEEYPLTSDWRVAVLVICFIIGILFAITLSIDIYASQGIIVLPSWLSVGNIDDARSLLGSIIASVSTVLGLVFSVVLLVLSMAANQFGPRLLRRFILDHNGESTVGLFTATFLYSVAALVVVHSGYESDFVPQVTIITSVFLMITAFASLIVFSQNIRAGIQTGNLLARVTKDLEYIIPYYLSWRKTHTICKLRHSSKSASVIVSPDTTEPRPSGSGIPLANARGSDLPGETMTESSKSNNGRLSQSEIIPETPIFAIKAGYLQKINHQHLITIATEMGSVITLDVRPGNFIMKGTVLAYVATSHNNIAFSEKINHALYIGDNRVLMHDPEFALAQIVEIGIRALSPAVNDSYTGLACVYWLANNILSLIDLPDGDYLWQDKMGKTRLIEKPVSFKHCVASAFDMIREASSSNPAVLISMLHKFASVAIHLKNDEQRSAILRQVKAIREVAELQSFTQTDLHDIMTAYEHAYNALITTQNGDPNDLGV